jgi:hypothetical protein
MPVESWWSLDGHKASKGGRLITPWPLPNIWLGTSVEGQRYADLRISHLLATPAAVRFLSIEPLLGPVVLRPEWLGRCAGCGEFVPSDEITGDWHVVVGHDPYCTGVQCSRFGCPVQFQCGPVGPRVDWVIVGGESGPGARPMHPQWVRDMRDQCVAAGVPFHFKQWGAWAPWIEHERSSGYPYRRVGADGSFVGWSGGSEPEGSARMAKMPKKAAGRELDGRTWDEYPA